MEVKSIYMDLVEGKKKGNVWKLESEAFKDPIEIKICYDNQDLKDAYREIANLKETVESCDRRVTHLGYDWTRVEEIREEFTNKIGNKQEQINHLKEKIDSLDEERKSLYKEVATQKTMIETLGGTVLRLQEQMKLLDKKVTKQPTVIHDKGFISGRESAGLGMIDLVDGEYLMIAKYVVGEHNEYVENHDEILFEKIHVDGGSYIPFYKLEGGTELDTPTATIYYDLIFIPV